MMFPFMVLIYQIVTGRGQLLDNYDGVDDDHYAFNNVQDEEEEEEINEGLLDNYDGVDDNHNAIYNVQDEEEKR